MVNQVVRSLDAKYYLAAGAVKQYGAALLMLMLVIVLITTIGLFNVIDPNIKKNYLDQRTEESLTEAKEALIAYVVSTYDLANPPDNSTGILVRFPCPDTGLPEGQQAFPTCDFPYAAPYVNAIGRVL